MTIDRKVDFAEPLLHSALAQMTDDELDALPFGVVEMDHTGSVVRYNAAEQRLSGLPAERVIGRNFFRDVAPCTDNRHVAQRFDQPSVDETIEYVFSLHMKPVPVTLRLLKSGDDGLMYVVVTWR